MIKSMFLSLSPSKPRFQYPPLKQHIVHFIICFLILNTTAQISISPSPLTSWTPWKFPLAHGCSLFSFFSPQISQVVNVCKIFVNWFRFISSFDMVWLFVIYLFSQTRLWLPWEMRPWREWAWPSGILLQHFGVATVAFCPGPLF